MWRAPSSGAQLNATWAPSEENAGVDSDPASAVNGETIMGGAGGVRTHHEADPATNTANTTRANRTHFPGEAGAGSAAGTAVAGAGAAALPFMGSGEGLETGAMKR